MTFDFGQKCAPRPHHCQFLLDHVLNDLGSNNVQRDNQPIDWTQRLQYLPVQPTDCHFLSSKSCLGISVVLVHVQKLWSYERPSFVKVVLDWPFLVKVSSEQVTARWNNIRTKELFIVCNYSHGDLTYMYITLREPRLEPISYPQITNPQSTVLPSSQTSTASTSPQRAFLPSKTFLTCKLSFKNGCA